MFHEKEELKKWLEDYIDKNGKRSLHIAISNSKNIKQSLIEHTSFLPDYVKYNQRCYHIINNLYEIPKCKHCDLNYVNFNNRNKEWRYLDYCSTKCGRSNEKSKKKYKETCIKKWGVDNFSKTVHFKESMVDTNRIKYGIDWYMESLDFREKSIITCLLKYGFKNFTQTSEFREKTKSTFLKKYGVDWYSKSSEFREKFRKTCLERYGCEHFLQNDLINIKFKKQFKDYVLPSGQIIRIQGYENKALDILLEKYLEDDLVISNAEIRNEIGIINYFIDNREKIYIPDIYIKSENKIIEVKSKWIYEQELQKNQIKKESCLNLGFNFEFWIISKNNLVSIL
jgi:hypothetical protein